MKTLVLRVSPEKPEAKKIRLAGEIIKKGGIVAFPTETVYGLGADALNEKAVKKIFNAKGRPQDNPIIVHIYSEKQLREIAVVNEKALRIAKRFWPGPLTMILKKKECVPKNVTAGLKTVAVRMPSHKIARMLCRQCNPIAAPSANLSGKPSAVTAKHVREDFFGKIECILDSGNAFIGLESTVIDMTSKKPVILRPGGISVEQLKKVIPGIKVHAVASAEKNAKTAKSPGTKYRHYAPKAKLVLIEGKNIESAEKAVEIAGKYAKTKKTALIFLGNTKPDTGKKIKVIRIKEKKKIASKLFIVLRELDSENIEVIVCNSVTEKGLGLAIMNRLRKASSQRIKA